MLRPTYGEFINDTPLEYLPVTMTIIHWGLGSPSGSKRFRKAKKVRMATFVKFWSENCANQYCCS